MSLYLAHSVLRFVRSCGRQYAFPAGGDVPYLTDQESELLKALGNAECSESEMTRILSCGLDWTECYDIAIFGIRLSVLAVRSGDPHLYHLGLLALVAGCTKVDWRDTLGALSIFEDCGKRLGIRLQSEIEQVPIPGEGSVLKDVIAGYFSRDDRMRSVDVMGLRQIGDGDEFTFM